MIVAGDYAGYLLIQSPYSDTIVLRTLHTKAQAET
ncbi:hypothetical protein K788_00015975 [Paraburkholderia caribensis MBA4]|uniref:Uncharacterized protein n=1 Tax=Paraburkholderia caribensis MBA4 TaxID=1323664 RepID=A0A0N7JUM8_9BURK|nr:hypothetical protein K788_00015975 [Paraburkholderia caribensis MBA4]